MRAIFLFLGLLIFSGCVRKNNVLFGDRKLNDFSVNDGEVIKIHFDKEGIIYPPNCLIPNSLLKENGNTFMTNYLSKSKKISSYSGNLGCEGCFQQYSKIYQTTDSTNFSKEFNKVSIKKIVDKINEINNKSSINNITFLMVGFNNFYDNQSNANENAIFKLEAERKKIESVIGKNKTIFVELYWDATITKKNGIKTAMNYSKAIGYSLKTGLSLRQLISNIDDKYTINLFSHSMGANIICEALFNQETKLPRKASKHAQLFNQINSKYKDSVYKVPEKQKINAAIIAPAISGVYTFKDYYKRNKNFNRKDDNYRFFVGYNINDPDLRKSFGKGAIGFIVKTLNQRNKLILSKPMKSTSLGCLDSEVRRVSDLFRKNFDKSKIKFYDFSFTEINGKNLPNSFHSILQYLNKKQFEELIKDVYKDSPTAISGVASIQN